MCKCLDGPYTLVNKNSTLGQTYFLYQSLYIKQKHKENLFKYVTEKTVVNIIFYLSHNCC